MKTARKVVFTALRNRVKPDVADLAASRVLIVPWVAVLSVAVWLSHHVWKAVKQEPSVMFSRILAYQCLAGLMAVMHSVI